MFKSRQTGAGTLPAIAALALLVLLTSFPITGQGNALDNATSDDYRISIDVGLVVLPVFVTDRKGKAVPGLGENSFQVFEDGRPQQIALFKAEDVPVTVGLVIDNSASMGNKRPEVVAAAVDFAKSSNPRDEMFVVNFNQDVSLGLPKGVPFTNDTGELLSAVLQKPASGNTAIYDGLAVALDHLKSGTAIRKALILISDGQDNASLLSFGEVLRRAEASNAQIYTLGVFDSLYSGDASKNASVLKRLAKATGGKAYFPQSPSQIGAIFQEISRGLRHQYTIGYHPSNSSSTGTYHAIRVTVRGPAGSRLRVSTRAGYLMPVQPQAAPPAPAKTSS